MTSVNDRADGASASAQKSRRRRPSLGGVAQPATPLTTRLDDSPVLAPSPPPIEPMEDEDDTATPPSRSGRSRSRSNVSTRKSKRGTASVTRSRRMTAAASILATAKNARPGLLDGRDIPGVGAYTCSNNNEDEVGGCFQEEGRADEEDRGDARTRQSRSRRTTVSNGPELFALPSREPEAVSDQPKGERRSGPRPILPSRSRHYRQLSAGPNKSSIAHQHVDRPPSRQRHAFPTHLIDANAFCASPDGGVAGEIDAEEDIPTNEVDLIAHSSRPGGVSSTKNERPPSRYMVKSNHRAHAGSASSCRSIVKDINTTPPQTDTPGADDEEEAGGRRILSRRLAVEYGSFSCNQAHHDPKTDGFADVDESIPPPFRIEITNEPSSPPSPSSLSSSSTPPTSYSEIGYTGRTSGRPPRRAASFSSNNQHQQQIGQPTTRPGDARAPKSRHSLKSTFNPLQWFGDDDQINNPDNFETVITSSSPPHIDPSLDGDFGDPSNERDEDEDVDHVRRESTQWPIMQPPPTASMPYKSGSLSWMVQSLGGSNNNGKAMLKGSVPDYDSMAADTAIAETPLYDGSEDLMTIATQMSDLRLDDYSLADAMATVSTGGGGGNNAGNGSTAAGLGGVVPPLHTSLGRDFLSLFAQH